MSSVAAEPQHNDATSAPPSAVASIHIDRLYGKFTYDLDLAPSGNDASEPKVGDLFTVNEDRLTLVYGPNGTGKTSLLRLLFHALSPAANKGHRTALFGTRFARFDVALTNGTRISYVRPEGELEGPYRGEIAAPGPEEAVGMNFYGRGRSRTGVEETGRLVDDDDLEKERFIRTLVDLGFNPVFLGDSRAITADVLDETDLLHRRAREGAFRRPMEVEELLRQRRDIDVEDALERVRGYLSQLAFAGAQAGSQRVDNVYLNVATAIIQHAPKVGRPKKQLLPSLQKRVAELGNRAERFHEYGLLPEFPAATLIELLDDAPDKNGPLLVHALTPYLDGQAQRMDALEPGLQAVAAYIDALNSFLDQKIADFRPGRGGVRILDQKSGEKLEAPALSSGEKQIVLLFSDIIALQGQTSLFIIDEPELSLNPEWQRRLMPSLLKVTQQSGMQLIAATHSIEIMARYRSRIRRLLPD